MTKTIIASVRARRSGDASLGAVAHVPLKVCDLAYLGAVFFGAGQEQGKSTEKLTRITLAAFALLASVGVGKADDFVTIEKSIGDWLVKSSGDGTRYAGCNLRNNQFASANLEVVEFRYLKPPGESVTMDLTRSLPFSRKTTASIAVDDDFHINVEGNIGDVESRYFIDTNKANQILDAIAGAAKSSKRTRITFDGTVFTLPLSGFEEALAQFKACLGR